MSQKITTIITTTTLKTMTAATITVLKYKTIKTEKKVWFVILSVKTVSIHWCLSDLSALMILIQLVKGFWGKKHQFKCNGTDTRRNSKSHDCRYERWRLDESKKGIFFLFLTITNTTWTMSNTQIFSSYILTLRFLVVCVCAFWCLYWSTIAFSYKL